MAVENVYTPDGNPVTSMLPSLPLIVPFLL